MQNLTAWLVGLGGFGIGVAAGFAVRHARLCTFAAIEDALMGSDTRRLRIFALALGIAILGTQALILGSFLDPEQTSHTSPALPLVAIVIGSLMFGIGMAMVGTCGFGSLVLSSDLQPVAADPACTLTLSSGDAARTSGNERRVRMAVFASGMEARRAKTHEAGASAQPTARSRREAPTSYPILGAEQLPRRGKTSSLSLDRRIVRFRM